MVIDRGEENLLPTARSVAAFDQDEWRALRDVPTTTLSAGRHPRRRSTLPNEGATTWAASGARVHTTLTGATPRGSHAHRVTHLAATIQVPGSLEAAMVWNVRRTRR